MVFLATRMLTSSELARDRTAYAIRLVICLAPFPPRLRHFPPSSPPSISKQYLSMQARFNHVSLCRGIITNLRGVVGLWAKLFIIGRGHVSRPLTENEKRRGYRASEALELTFPDVVPHHKKYVLAPEVLSARFQSTIIPPPTSLICCGAQT